MQSFIDFLDFRFFISPHVLVVCYYIGALVVPVGIWFLALWAKHKYFVASDIYEFSKTTIFNITGRKGRILFYAGFALFLFCMEIMWRMLFEFMIAYLQMREALLELTTH